MEQVEAFLLRRMHRQYLLEATMVILSLIGIMGRDFELAGIPRPLNDGFTLMHGALARKIYTRSLSRME
jgi:hypothetical protein